MQKGGYQILDLSECDTTPSGAHFSVIQPSIDAYNLVLNTRKPILLYPPKVIKTVDGNNINYDLKTYGRGVFTQFYGQPNSTLYAYIPIAIGEVTGSIIIYIATDNYISFKIGG